MWKVVLRTSLRLPICWFSMANPHSFKCTIYPLSNYIIWPMLKFISALNRNIPYPPMMIASSIVLTFDDFPHHNVKVECMMHYAVTSNIQIWRGRSWLQMKFIWEMKA